MPPKKATASSKAPETIASKATKAKATTAKSTSSSSKAAPKATKASKAAKTSASKSAPEDSSKEITPPPEEPKSKQKATAKGAAAATTKKTLAKKATPAPETTKAVPAPKTSAKKRKSPDSSEEEEPVEKKAKTTKAADTKAAPAPKTATKKRKSPDATDEEPVEKKAKTTKAATTKISTNITKATAAKPKAPPKEKAPPKPRAPPKPKPVTVKPKIIINEAPTERLNVYVCGEGSSGELGLGNAKNAIDVKRPRLNAHLAADTVGVVALAVGGMHVAALTHDSKIYTWGVNDQGALGRDTQWDGGLMDIDDADKEEDSSEDSEDDSGLNPREATPTVIPDDAFPPGTKFVEVAAGDSVTYALTDDGFVYGWGTFRSNEGILGFSATSGVQRTPVLVENLKKIKHLVCGDNHVLALDHKGSVFSWGSGQQNQLGRRIVERLRMGALKPAEFGLKGVTGIGAGAYHSFAIHKDGKVYSWGLNNFGETGVEDETRRQVKENAEQVIWKPQIVAGLEGKEITCITGGAHHSIAVTNAGECLAWGRVDGFQMGMKIESLSKDYVLDDEKGNPRILLRPTALAGIDAVYATAGSDHNIAITTAGKAYSWGFSANYQTGQGDDEDVEVAKMIDNTAVRDQKLNWAGAGGQFSVLTSAAS